MTRRGKTSACLGIVLAGLCVAAGTLLLDVAGPTPATAHISQPTSDAHVSLALNEVGDPAPLSSSQPPSRPDSLQEGYQDWQVVCASDDEGRQCAVIQQQADGRTKQRMLAVELTHQNGATQGALILPFGLDLTNGVQLRIDEQEHLEMLPFSTCLPGGCMVPLNLDEDNLAAMRSGQTIAINVRSHDSQDVAFSVSLQGFSQAWDRIRDLD